MRSLIESSRAVKVPTVPWQLAGAKKIQQVVALPGVLERFALLPRECELLRATFVGLYALDAASIALALANPHQYVLKPQRMRELGGVVVVVVVSRSRSSGEGGGNNLYDEELSKALRTMNPASYGAWILMEKIIGHPFASHSMRNATIATGQFISGECSSRGKWDVCVRTHRWGQSWACTPALYAVLVAMQNSTPPSALCCAPSWPQSTRLVLQPATVLSTRRSWFDASDPSVVKQYKLHWNDQRMIIKSYTKGATANHYIRLEVSRERGSPVCVPGSAMHGLARAVEVRGTFDDRAFQLCYKRGLSSAIDVPLLDGLGYPCVPLLGTYAESYEPVLPLVLVQTDFQAARVPPPVAAACAGRAPALFLQIRTYH